MGADGLIEFALKRAVEGATTAFANAGRSPGLFGDTGAFGRDAPGPAAE